MVSGKRQWSLWLTVLLVFAGSVVQGEKNDKEDVGPEQIARQLLDGSLAPEKLTRRQIEILDVLFRDYPEIYIKMPEELQGGLSQVLPRVPTEKSALEMQALRSRNDTILARRMFENLLGPEAAAEVFPATITADMKLDLPAEIFFRVLPEELTVLRNAPFSVDLVSFNPRPEDFDKALCTIAFATADLVLAGTGAVREGGDFFPYRLRDEVMGEPKPKTDLAAKAAVIVHYGTPELWIHPEKGEIRFVWNGPGAWPEGKILLAQLFFQPIGQKEQMTVGVAAAKAKTYVRLGRDDRMSRMFYVAPFVSQSRIRIR